MKVDRSIIKWKDGGGARHKAGRRGEPNSGAVLDAVITAGGRLSAADAKTFGTDVKALVHVGGRPILDSVVAALRGTPGIERIAVVGPPSVRATTPDVDIWIDEYPTGEENLMAGLRAAATDRIVLSASDLPFVVTRSYADLIERTPPDVDAGYPIFTEQEFLRAYPGGRSQFATLADGRWTGGSAFVLNRAPFLRDEWPLRRAFGARKSLLVLAGQLGPRLLALYLTKRLRIADVERRAGELLRARFKAIVGADPALAMDCDELGDFKYARADGSR